MIRRDAVRRTGSLFLLSILAACGGHQGNSALPAGPIPVTGTAHKTASHLEQSGVSPSVLRGYATSRASSERLRKSGQRAPQLAAGPSGGLREAQSISTESTGSAKTLVLYDNAGQWGFLGELYALATANLAGHFGTVSSEPVQAYVAGQLSGFTSTIYIGSSYYDASNDQIPAAFYKDVAASTRPVLWMGDNIWNFANAIGPVNFEKSYGWDPTNSYYAPNGSVGSIQQVTYKNQALTRSTPTGQDGGVLHPAIMGAGYPAETTIAQAVDSSTSPATTFPWAIKSKNLTYIGEIPFDYVTESNRVIALEDMLFDVLAPSTTTRHRAMVRLEDISAQDDMTQVRAAATYLYNQHIPFGFNVIPYYTDPLGHYNNGVPQSITLAQAPEFVSTIKYLIAHGGSMVAEGYSHQYPGSNANPYDGVSGDDAEFFRAHVDATNSVIWDGPVSEDASGYAAQRISNSLAAFAAVGLPAPKLWITPHYFATDTDYRAIGKSFSARYERSLYFQGDLTGSAPNYANYIGEFFPYIVKDAYGTKVIPENIGDYEPVAQNNHPVRLPADLIHNAQLNLAVRDGFASFFYDPSYPLQPLADTVTGIRSLGYTFVSPGSL
ncbi:MAG: DUF2334 domain-containing protein [Candidatus Eremiobacteraeota bacterium]|nr:DUF2334 domain-containing protein [Candidatus Eremiobacteraeota bacterium]